MEESKVQTIQGYGMLIAIGIITIITSIYGLIQGQNMVGVTMAFIGIYLTYSNAINLKNEKDRKEK